MHRLKRFLPFVAIATAVVVLAQPLWAMKTMAMAQTAQPTPTLATGPATATITVTVTPDPNAAAIPRVHVVVEGETLTSIAAEYGVSVEEILAINNLPNVDLLQLGQELIIPGGVGEAVATAYTVTAGDTTAEIAALFNTTPADVAASNRLIYLGAPLHVGQVVPVISRTGSGAPRPVTGQPYLVAEGDTLLTVAARHNLTPAGLMVANELTTPYLFPGQRLRIPDETAVYRRLPEGWLDVRLSPAAIGQGSTLSVYVANLLPGRPAGRLGEQALQFAPSGDGYAALVGIDAFAEPGVYDLELSGGDERDLWQPLRAQVPITATAFDTQYVTVGEALDGLLDPAVRAEEDEFLRGIYANFSEDQQWQGVFTQPLTTTVISAGYGGRRSYNGGPIEIYHTGLDLAAPEGQTVSAPAAGIVVFSAPLDLRGHSIIIDHGRGVMSGFYHLAARSVDVGERVAAGQEIGSVGSTGLSSGPHLHWDVRIMNVPVDPLVWTQQTFP